MSRTSTQVTAVALALLLPMTVLAQGRIEDFDLDELMDINIRVSAASGRSQGLLEAPATVSVLERADIRESGARTVPDLLRRIPGMQIYQTAPGIFTVALRGMSGLQDNNVIVLLDDLPLNNVFNGSIDWAGLPVSVDQIERIEVVRGPVSTIYGANAYTGVIAISTAREVEGVAVDGGVNGGSAMSAGSYQAQAHAAARGKSGGWDWAVMAQGGRDSLYVNVPRVPSLTPQIPATAGGGGGRVSWDINEKLSLSARVYGSYDEQSGLNNLVITPVRTRQSLVRGGLQLDVHKLQTFLDSVRVWSRWHYNSMNKADPAALDFSLDGTRVAFFEGGAKFRFALPFDIPLDLGLEATAANVESPLLFPTTNGVWRGGYAADLSTEIHLGRQWLLSGGGRVDYNALSRWQGSYRGSVHFTGSKASVRLTAAHGFRNPTYVEIAGRLVDPRLNIILLEGSSNIAPQAVTSLELAVVVAPVRKLIINPVIYALQLDQIISEDFGQVVQKTYANVQRPPGIHVDLVGGELEVLYEVSAAFVPRAAASLLWWPTGGVAPSATVGVPRNNSTLTASLGIRGEILEKKLSYGVGADFVTARSYAVRAGVPPSILNADVPAHVRLDASIRFRPFAPPFWLWLKAQSTLPSLLVESPFPGAVGLGTSAMLGVEWVGSK